MRWTSRTRNAASPPRPRKVAGTRQFLEPHRSRSTAVKGLSLIGLFCLCFSTAMCAQHAPAQPIATEPASTPRPSQKLASGPAAQGGTSTPIQPRPPEFQFLILLDPAHGGTDNGATLGPAGLEKNYTLALAVRLRALLNANRIRSILTRDADVTLDGTTRAEIANRAHAAACILLHTTSTGTGVHLFTSSLPAAEQPDPKQAFLPWQTAQAAYITPSLRLESDIDAALTRQQVPVLLDRTSFMPLDSMACPAVAVEVAPLNATTPLTDAAYQQKILNSLNAALIAWRGDWRSQP